MTLLKEIYKKWRDSLCSWIGRRYIIHMVFLTRSIYRFNVITNQMLLALFKKTEKF